MFQQCWQHQCPQSGYVWRYSLKRLQADWDTNDFCPEFTPQAGLETSGNYGGRMSRVGTSGNPFQAKEPYFPLCTLGIDGLSQLELRLQGPTEASRELQTPTRGLAGTAVRHLDVA